MAKTASKRYLIVEPSVDGTGVEIHEMMKWCRLHPNDAPKGLSLGANTHAYARGLARMGWIVEPLEKEVRIYRPGTSGAADAVFGEDSSEGTLAASPESTNDENETESVQETVFHLERQLQAFIASNLSTLRVDGRRLRLHSDERGSGMEYPTGGNRRIDILAVDEDGGFVVLELKRGAAPDKAIGQLADYMGWVQLNLARGKPVRGVIVSREISESLRQAIVVFPNVSLFEYRIQFELSAIGPAEGQDA